MKNYFLLLLLFFSASGFAQKKIGEQRPNVLIIFMDDMGYGDPDCYAGIGYNTQILTGSRLRECAIPIFMRHKPFAQHRGRPSLPDVIQIELVFIMR
jgi:hypothetical protein